MLDYKTPNLDTESKIQLIVIELDKINEALLLSRFLNCKKIDKWGTEMEKIVGDFSARLRILEGQKLPQAINILESEVRELKKANQISESIWLPKEGKELKKKFNLRDLFK